MNARTKCKKLKQRNELLMHIVNKDPGLRMTYDNCTKPFKIVSSYMHFETYAARCPLEPMLGNNARPLAEDRIVRELSEAIKKNVEWRYDDRYDPRYEFLEGRIIIGRKEVPNV